jgi:hypothetical protein
MESEVENHDRLVLQLKVCSARKLGTPLNSFVSINFGSWSRQTSTKKNSEKPIWNETLVFAVDRSEHGLPAVAFQLRYKDLLGKLHDLGHALVQLPSKINELVDTWVKLESTGGDQPDLHICMQLEYLGSRSIESLVGRQSNRPSLMRFGSSSLRLLSTRGNNGLGEVSGGDARLKKEVLESPSTFGVRTGAVTLNEICQNLDRLRGLIYLSSAEAARDPDERVQQLQRSKVELDELESQVDAIEGLSDEWKDKLTLLIEDYARDCWKMLSDESWERLTQKRQSVRAPPPLPSKREMDKIRKERQSTLANGSTSTPSPRPRDDAGSRSPEGDRASDPRMSPAQPTQASPESPQQSSQQARSPQAQPRQPKQHSVIVRDHFMSSLDAFDEMMDIGFAVEFPLGAPSNSQVGRHGDLASFVMTSFIYDAVICKIISYDGPSLVEFVLGSHHPDIPRGLETALSKIPGGNSRAMVTVSPNWGFGDDGHEKGVPPNSTLVFVIENTSFVTTASSSNPFDDLIDSPTISLVRLYGTFPAREPQVVLESFVPPPAVAPPAPPRRPPLARSQSASQEASRAPDNDDHKATLQQGMVAELNVRLSRRGTYE